MKVIIIGAGASGMTAAISAASANAEVIILEHSGRAGKKLLSTGNGKCNYTNLNISAECYHSENGSFAMSALEHFNVYDCIEFFRELGVEPYIREGYVYPMSEQASSVLSALEMRLEMLKVKLVTDCDISDIKYSESGIEIISSKGRYLCDRLIFAIGGSAFPSSGSDMSGYVFLKKLGYKIRKQLPALCPLYSVQDKRSLRFFKQAAGVRVKAAISLYIDRKFIKSEYGELQLTDYGVSGIPVFQLAVYASRAIDEGKKVSLLIDFLPAVRDKAEFMKKRAANRLFKSVSELGNGIINSKLWSAIMEYLDIKPGLAPDRAPLEALAAAIESFRADILKTADENKAQVSSGGVCTGQIVPETMESRLHRGIYFAGEVIDVDGICGGYNLQWAWTSGYLAGKAAAGEK